MIDSIFEKALSTFIIITAVLFIISIPFSAWELNQTNEDLQIILKNECNMDYSIEEVRRNGETLARICGLKNN